MVNAGEGVDVTEFGGEGTGIKTMRDFYWREGDEITFIVEAELVGKIFTLKILFFHINYQLPISCIFVTDNLLVLYLQD